MPKINLKNKNQKGAITIILSLAMAVIFSLIVLASMEMLLNEQKRSAGTAPSVEAIQLAEEASHCVISQGNSGKSIQDIFGIGGACEQYKDFVILRIKEPDGNYEAFLAKDKLNTSDPPIPVSRIVNIRAIGSKDYEEILTGEIKTKQRIMQSSIYFPQTSSTNNSQQANNCQDSYDILPGNNTYTKVDEWLDITPECKSACVADGDTGADNYNPCAIFDPSLSGNGNPPGWCPKKASDNLLSSEAEGSPCFCANPDSDPNHPYKSKETAIQNFILINGKTFKETFCSPCNRIRDFHDENYCNNETIKTEDICDNIWGEAIDDTDPIACQCPDFAANNGGCNQCCNDRGGANCNPGGGICP
jgi:Tfp pilus assembly protein PilX